MEYTCIMILRFRPSFRDLDRKVPTPKYRIIHNPRRRAAQPWRRIAATNDLGYFRGYTVVLESAEVALRGWGVSSDDGPMGLGSAFVESIP